MIDFAVNLQAVDSMSQEFPWAVGAMVLMVVTGVALTLASNRNRRQAGS